jgi:hypothetical protein
MNEADAQTARRGDAVIIFDATSKIISQLCNAYFSRSLRIFDLRRYKIAWFELVQF